MKPGGGVFEFCPVGAPGWPVGAAPGYLRLPDIVGVFYPMSATTRDESAPVISKQTIYVSPKRKCSLALAFHQTAPQSQFYR